MAIKTKLTIDVPSRERLKQTITLLSQGAANPKAFPDGQITVYPWDVQVDDWLVKSGRNTDSSVFDVIPKLAELNGCDLDDLFVGDASTILLVSRSLRHGNKIDFSPVCTNCRKTNNVVTLDVPRQLRKLAEKPKGWGGTDTIVLPSIKDEIEIRPLRLKDEKAIENMTPEAAAMVPPVTARMCRAIVSVGGGKPDSVAEIVSYLRRLDPVDQDYLSEQIDALHPRLDSDVTFVCDYCGKQFVYTISFDRNFFRSRVA